MLEQYRLYLKANYTMQKSVNLDDRLYTRIKEIADYDLYASLSDLVNVCIEEMLLKGRVFYYPKPYGEIALYRSLMLRKDNLRRLEEIKNIRGFSITRMINLAIKEFITRYDNENKQNIQSKNIKNLWLYMWNHNEVLFSNKF